MMSFRSIFLFLVLAVAAVSAGTNQEGLAFLAKKATENGVVTLDSGMMYKGMSITITMTITMRVLIFTTIIQYERKIWSIHNLTSFIMLLILLAHGKIFNKKIEMKAGAGDKRAKIGTKCSCHYAGTLIDGTEFDSSYKRGKVRLLPASCYLFFAALK
jgi:hypothetical protein